MPYQAIMHCKSMHSLISRITRVVMALSCALLGFDGNALPVVEALPDRFEQWVAERVGPVVYPSTPDEGPNWDSLASACAELGPRAVKTWVGAARPGETLEKLQSDPYQGIIAKYSVVHLNLSQSFIKDGMSGDQFDRKTFDSAIQEWRDATLYLCEQSKLPGQIFLLSVGAELNIYVGTEFSKSPDFPVAEYVNACHAAVTEALESIKGPRPMIYTVAEIQSDVEFEEFVRRWAPVLETDLISLSHYAFYRDISEPLALIRKYMKPIGPFGRDRLMLGEFGPTMEGCWVAGGNWNQTAHVKNHDAILRKAYAERIQFAFFYELADQPAVIKSSGHDGLVGWNKDGSPYYRLAWYYYRDIYRGQNAKIPDYDLYEIHNQKPPRPDGDGANLCMIALDWSDSEVRAGDKVAFTVSVKNSGNQPSDATTVSFFVNDRTVSWAHVPKLKSGQSIEVKSTDVDENYFWKAIDGEHRVTAVIDPKGLLVETNYDDNEILKWVHVQSMGDN